MNYLIRYISVTIFGLSAYWLGSKPEDIKALLSLLASLAGILGSDVKHFTDNTRKSLDRKLFAGFLKDLPSSGSIRFLKDHDMGASFLDSNLDQLLAYANKWTDAEHEFLDPAIEHCKLHLNKLIDQLRESIGVNTFPLDSNFHMQSVLREWSRKHPERWNMAVAELNRLADETCSAHQNLVRLGRNRLGSDFSD